MRSMFWNCEVQKNWAGAFRDEMLDRNIVCYGKPGSGRMEKVIKPFLRHAIEAGRSILLLSRRDDEDYAEIYEMAEEKGYDIWEGEPLYWSECDPHEMKSQGVEMMFDLLSAPTMYCVRMENEGRWENNSVQCALRSLRAAERKGMLREDKCRISLVIDDADWEVVVPRDLRRCSWLNFCITMDNMRLTQADIVRKRCVELRSNLEEVKECNDDGSFFELLQDMNAVMQSGDHSAVVSMLNEKVDTTAFANHIHPILTSCNDALVAPQMREIPDGMIRSYAAFITGHSVQDFFEDVQTVVCTGVGGISPEEHRAFQEACVIPPGVRALGGKYLVTELCAPLQGMPKSVFPKTVMTWAKNISVESIFRNDFRPGRCVVEQNGAVKMYASYHGSLIPMVFPAVSEALIWLDKYFTQQGWGSPEAVEVDHCSLRYLLPVVNDRGEQEEIIISYIQKDDVNAYVEQAMMISMEVEEYLTHPELMSEVPGLALKQEAANISLQKIASFACRNYRRVRKVAEVQLPVDEKTNEQVSSMIEEYKWRPYQKPAPVVQEEPAVLTSDILPRKRVLFLGGHANMVKKLRQEFPDWAYLTDDELGNWNGGECDVIFFWSNHSSHPMWNYVTVRKRKETPYLYVKSTNINRLIAEMTEKYANYLEKQAVVTT